MGYSYHATTDRLTSDGTTTYGYDANGNLDSAGTTTYTYTPFNMLETATVAGVATTYRYDADHQRRMGSGPNGLECFVSGPGLVPLAEYREVNAVLSLEREYIYAGTRLLASVETPSTVSLGEPIVAGQTVVKAAHLTALRTEVNKVQALYGLPSHPHDVGRAVRRDPQAVPGEVRDVGCDGRSSAIARRSRSPAAM